MHFETLVMMQGCLKDSNSEENQKILSPLIKFYKNDKKYRNISIAKTIFHLLVLENGRFFALFF